MKEFVIGKKKVGSGHGAYIIAEIGYNFNTIEEGVASVEAAAGCGVDAVKFQTFRAQTVTSRINDFPDVGGGGNQFDEFKRYELSAEHHRILWEAAARLSLDVFSTPAYYEDAELLMGLGVPVMKTGADDLTNTPFLSFLAKKGLPMIVSTGMGTMEEVARAVDAILSTGNDKLVLLQTVSNYPIKNLADVNLRAMLTLSSTFGVLAGYSDHTTTLSVPCAAAALGMAVYERHFTIDKKLPAPDAALSADPAEMTAIVKGIREVESAMGNGIKQPAKSEVLMRRDARKSLIALIDLPAGHKLVDGDTIVKRPAWGIAPADAAKTAGMVLTKPVKKDEPITWDHFRDPQNK